MKSILLRAVFIPQQQIREMSIACDIPASRIACGFTGHHSRMGCNKCNEAFGVGVVGIANDYSSFENCT